MSDIPGALRQHRALKGVSRAQAARELGVHDHTLRAWETGQHDIPLGKAMQLCEYYGTTISELIGEEPVQDLSEVSQLLKVLEAGIESLRRREEDQ